MYVTHSLTSVPDWPPRSQHTHPSLSQHIPSPSTTTISISNSTSNPNYQFPHPHPRSETPRRCPTGRRGPWAPHTPSLGPGTPCAPPAIDPPSPEIPSAVAGNPNRRRDRWRGLGWKGGSMRGGFGVSCGSGSSYGVSCYIVARCDCFSSSWEAAEPRCGTPHSAGQVDPGAAATRIVL